MNRHEQALLKAQSTVEKNKKFVKRYAKKKTMVSFYARMRMDERSKRTNIL